MIYLPLAMVAEGQSPADLPTFLEAGVVLFKVLDVFGQFFDHGNEALVARAPIFH